ncbi:MAG TPA: hypothetical protein VFP60_00475 [Pseudolabrys sp.]|nr:hypothetical protein [Pseudolabrys sp.]
MSQHENDDRARAERLFKMRERQKADAPKATADYYAAQERLRARTLELRRLRLAREARQKHG